MSICTECQRLRALECADCKRYEPDPVILTERSHWYYCCPCGAYVTYGIETCPECGGQVPYYKSEAERQFEREADRLRNQVGACTGDEYGI